MNVIYFDYYRIKIMIKLCVLSHWYQRSPRGGASRSAGLIRPLPPPFYCIFRPLFLAARVLFQPIFWKCFQKTTVFRYNWPKLGENDKCFRMLAEKTCFLEDSGGLFFRLFFRKKCLKNFNKNFENFRKDPPKIAFYCIFGPLFFKILEKFSKTAPSIQKEAKIG